MNFSIIWNAITQILDICIVWYAIYFALKHVKNSEKILLIVKCILFILVVKIIIPIFNLHITGVIFEYLLPLFPLAIVIIFQPEIRSVIESMGRSQLLGRHKVLTVDEREKVVYELMKSVEYFKKNRIGALIVIEREISLQEYIENSTKVYADLTFELLATIFLPNSPMHDGGVIIQGDRVTSAGAVFKTSMSPDLSKRLGTRHRAALGIAEESDALALVISEESGRISIACNNELKYNLTLDEFRMTLIDELNPKTEVFFEAEAEEDGEENA